MALKRQIEAQTDDVESAAATADIYRHYIYISISVRMDTKVLKIAEIDHSYSLNKHIIGQYGNPRFVVAIGLGYNVHEMAVAYSNSNYERGGLHNPVCHYKVRFQEW